MIFNKAKQIRGLKDVEAGGGRRQINVCTAEKHAKRVQIRETGPVRKKQTERRSTVTKGGE